MPDTRGPGSKRPWWRRAGLTIAMCVLSLCTQAPAFAQKGSSSVPPLPKAVSVMPEVTLYLEIIVNGQTTRKVLPVVQRGDEYYMQGSTLRALNLPVDSDGLVALQTLANMPVEYNQQRLSLSFHVPPNWLPKQSFAGSTGPAYAPAKVSPGAVLNYDVVVNKPPNGRARLSMTNELRFFGKFGSITSSSALIPGGGFRRFDTSWRYYDEKRIVTYEAGDVITRGTGLASAVRLGGIQISRDFSIRPDVLTYKVPSFSGTAALPSSLDLFIDGSRVQENDVQPGPYVLDRLPHINGAGEAVVVVTDIHGQQVQTTIPFYVSSQLLRPGLTDFSVAAGAMRRDFGRHDFSYGTLLFNGAVRHGVTDGLTLQGQAMLSRGYQLAGGGANLRIGYMGVVTGDYAYSRYHGLTGARYTVGYSYARRGFSFNAQHTRESANFYSYPQEKFDLSRLTARHPQTSTVATLGISGNRAGSFSFGYIRAHRGPGDRFESVNLSWSRTLFGNLSVMTRGDYSISDKKWSAYVGLSMPLGGRRGSAFASVDLRNDGRISGRAGYNRSVPTDGGIGGGAMFELDDRGNSRIHADVIWRNQLAQLRAGLNGAPNRPALWAGASGSLGTLGGEIFVANRIGDAFAVVETSGVPGVEIMLDNAKVGRTGKGGSMIVPWALSQGAARYQIDTQSLPLNVTAEVVEQQVRVRRGGGYRIRFDLERIVAATFILRDGAGVPIPIGSVIARDNMEPSYVGHDGFTYLTGLKASNKLRAVTPDGDTCSFTVDVDPNADRITQMGDVICAMDEK